MADHADNRRLTERDWQAIWEDVLDDSARRRIRQATRNGERLQNEDEAAVAVERALRLRRAAKAAAVANVVAGVVLIAVGFVLVDLPATASFWWFIGTLTTMVVLSPLAAWVRVRGLGRAIQANTAPRNEP